MAFMDKLGQMAGKAAEIAGDTIDYGKTKGKILLEKGKVKDGKEELGGYVYNTLKNGGELDQSRLDELMAEIDVHMAEIAKLEAEAVPVEEINEGEDAE